MKSILWSVGRNRSVELGDKSVIAGILNLTPDSFSDGGQFVDIDSACVHAHAMISAGAAIIDIGGESTRPGAVEVSAEEEQLRVLPIVERLALEGACLISVDTYRASTAELSLLAGAHIINDVWGLQREPQIAEVIARAKAGVIIMHTGRDREKLADVIEDQLVFFEKSLSIAKAAGIEREKIVLDPGFGFAKDERENLELMARMQELSALDYPLLVGTSRKRFLGGVTGLDAAERDAATAATSVILRQKGASLFRVHNVQVNRDALAMADAMMNVASGPARSGS